MKPKCILSFVAAVLFLTGCSPASDSAGAGDLPAVSALPEEAAAFEWTTELLYQAMLDSQLIESWGYKVGEGVSGVDDFAVDSADLITDKYSNPKPANCESALNLYLSRSEIDANYYSRVDHFDRTSLFKLRSFMLYTFTFDSPEKAKSKFEEFKSNQSECGSFSYMKGSEIFNVSLWDDKPSVDEATLVIGKEDNSANAFGLNGSAIWKLQVINGESGTDAEAIAMKAAEVINSGLTAIQGN